MKLLVSVRSADEATTALLAGADIIDAKDPSAGALGAVRPGVLAEIHDAVAGRRPLSAALGDATDAEILRRAVSSFVARGVQIVKIGFAGVVSPARISELLDAAVQHSQGASVVAVGYADASAAGSIDASELIEIAARAGARGILVDTAMKTGPGLTRLWSDDDLATWVARAHDAGLFAAVAGRLRAHDLGRVAESGADVVGVRGAACGGGRTGRVSRELVRQLARLAAQDDRNESLSASLISPAGMMNALTEGESAREK